MSSLQKQKIYKCPCCDQTRKSIAFVLWHIINFHQDIVKGFIFNWRSYTKGRMSCKECGVSNATNKVYEFSDTDGKECVLCDQCYEEHEIKGDWVS